MTAKKTPAPKFRATCGACKFFDTAPEGMEGLGMCRRHAPVLHLPLCAVIYGAEANKDILKGGRGIHPLVTNDEWCGEFEAK